LPVILEYMKPHLQRLGIDVAQRFWEHMTPVFEEPAAAQDDLAERPADANPSDC
jgi:hypothetical protein